VIRQLEGEQAAYFRWLPMYYPYLLKEQPETFVVQFGGGISTAVALQAGSRQVTVAEGNPALLHAFRTQKVLRDFTGDVLHNPRVRVIDHEGRLYLGRTDRRYDVIDLSLADSAGLSSPGGFAVVEKFSYTREAFVSYMRALKPDGILSVTLWNKEEPPKSVLSCTPRWWRPPVKPRGVPPTPTPRPSPTASLPSRATCPPPRCSTSRGASHPRSSTGCANTPTPCPSTASTPPTWPWTTAARSSC
jgi:hypothetical protein